jgi:hypothetical protein
MFETEVYNSTFKHKELSGYWITLLLTADVNSDVGCLDRAEVRSVADCSEIQAPSIFRNQVLCSYWPKRNTSP